MFSSRVPALLSLSLGIAAAYAPTDTSDTNPNRDWEAYKSKYKKSYRDQDDEAARHALFITAQARVAELNVLNGKAGSAFGTTWTSDRYPQETHKKGLRKPKDFVPSAPVREYSAPRRNPKSVNWRYTEAVTAIKNQGQCGSCWAFSAAEAVESQMILGTGGKVAIDLSPQQIASCTPSTGAHGCLGCEGGFTEGAYDYLRSVAGLANAFYIPYRQSLTETSTTKACPTALVEAIDGPDERLSGGYAAVSGYQYATPPCTAGSCLTQDLEKLAAALETAPISVCVNAGTWDDYTGGIISGAACAADADLQDHCVMATGFNTAGPTPYWIVRNSWSSTWGEEGYIYLEMAKNTCGLADDATIPQVKLDLSEEEEAEAATNREAMYQRATMGPK